MIKHPIQRFFGLTVLYSIIILGIFLLQFRSDTSISETFGGLKLRLVQTQTESQEKVLKNTFQISFQGMSLSSDEKNPLIATFLDGTTKQLSLENWNPDSDSSFSLYFDNQVSLRFMVTTVAKTNDSLTIVATLPEDILDVSVPYKPIGGYIVTEEQSSKLILSSKKDQYIATAFNFKNDRLSVSSLNTLATLIPYVPVTTFDFAMAETLPQASHELFLQTVAQFKANFIYQASQSINSSMSEQLAVAYVAAMAENGKYQEAIDEIPSSVKTSSKRTYLSAPYFNSLTTLNRSLEVQLESRRSMFTHAVQQNSLDIFMEKNLAELLCVFEAEPQAMQIASMPSNMGDFAPTVNQAAGIINTYGKLLKYNPILAAPLEKVIPLCLEKIASSVTVENESVTISEDKTELSFEDAVKVGMSLVQFGTVIEEPTYVATGYLITNVYMGQQQSISLATMVNLYPIIAMENTYYPHIKVISTSKDSGIGKPIWAWTVAEDITLSQDTQGKTTFSISFPVGQTHHLIINGITPFNYVQIYGVAYRTDPRFETYDASGYVYLPAAETFLLKSKHEDYIEDIVLYH